MNSNKVKEAKLLVEEAMKHLKTGFFKWRPDFDSAAASYQKAALTFKNARAFEQSYTSYMALADCHIKNGSRFHAGKAFEEAGQVQFKNLKDMAKGLSCFDRAAELYLEDGTPDTAALCLDRAGKIVQATHPEWSISSYMKAAEIYENEDQTRFRSAAEMIGKVARLQVSLKKYTEALKSIAHEMKLWSQVEGSDNGARARLTCALVLVHLQNGDQVRAEQSLYDSCNNIDGFDESEEYEALQQLLEAYNGGKQEEIARITNTPLFKYMDTAYAKLARSLNAMGYSRSQAMSNKTLVSSSENFTVSSDQDVPCGTTDSGQNQPAMPSHETGTQPSASDIHEIDLT
ncbi:gamma-soluble NSF attachment protein-like [Clavelina lepadiformis]|uniref:gamma-soluble NSF attachment protein-like n=1 Tax=Clavelina lepadiformis TaxID=159417 RepID=UPI004041ACB2